MNKYEIHIKSALLALAISAFIYSFANNKLEKTSRGYSGATEKSKIKHNAIISAL